MSGINSVLNIAKGALLAQQKAMTVTSHNIANVNTLGYTRQKVLLEANVSLSSDRIKLGTGVRVGSVIQLVDQYTNRAIQGKASSFQEYDSKAFILTHLEAIFNEATNQGLSEAMNQFWNAWNDLANRPGGIPERAALLGKAEILAGKFNSMRDDLSQIENQMNLNLKVSLEDVNRTTKQIAELNERIVSTESTRTPANDLRDKRASLVESLSELVGVSVSEDENGGLKVWTSTGILLVDNIQHWKFDQEGGKIYWNNIETDISKKFSGGKIGAWLDLRDEILPEYKANLDELAGTLMREVNGLHRQGYTLAGETGKAFFEDFKTPPDIPNAGDFAGAAAYIKLSSDVKGTPANIAVGGTSGDPGDNENGIRILSLQTDETIQVKKWSYKDRSGGFISSSLQTGTMEDYYRSLSGEVGMLVDEVSQNKDFDRAMIDQLTELKDSVSGVNLDEEMAELIKIQQAHEAAAKLVTFADEMLQSILQMR